jgi:DNA-binding NarL/FixJ family response regulator
MSQLVDPRAQHAGRMFPRQAIDPVLLLTERERLIIDLMSRPGRKCSIRAIAVELDLSEQTVKNHLYSAFKRLRVHSLAQAVRVILDRRAVANG